MINTINLTKIFEDKKRGRFAAVDNVTFSVQPGEIFGLLGLNGAGKTTTLRLLASLLKPTSGTAEICGLDVIKQPEAARARIGFMTGSTGLYGRLTASEMIIYFGKLYGMSTAKTKQRTEELISLLAMTEFATTRCDKLSAGTKQKVSIARTLVHDPDVIILDEPTVGLDVISSRNIVEFIHREKERSKTIIFSTHIMHEAEKLCDRIGIIHKGKIIDIDTSANLKKKAGQADMDDTFVKLIEETDE